MAAPNEKLAESLEALRELQERGITAINTNELTRTHRERLVEAGFLKEVVKGWYILSRNDEQQGDSTIWYASYWHFCSRYLAERFGENYWISADQSLQIYSGNQTVPTQLIVRSPNGTNSITPLPHGNSLFSMISTLPPAAEIVSTEGVRKFSLTSSLIHCSATMFTKNATDVRTALSMIKNSSEILRELLDGGHSTVAGRLAGAFRNIGQVRIADEILRAMSTAGYNVRETDPFDTPTPITMGSRDASPFVNRIKLMWHEMRVIVLKHFPNAPGLPTDHEKYMKEVEDLYVTDAYHSLSIEKYRVTPELIERVRTGTWDLQTNEEDKNERNAMAARGYWQASQAVRKSIEKILKGDNAGKIVDYDHSEWYLELFGPSVTAGIVKASDLAGYRNAQVYIGQSRHVPLNVEAVRDTMPVLFELLQEEKEPAVRAVLGHFIFVFIHPYMDGNGRMGRFLMNTMLASGGYPWTVIPVEERETYMKALEKASVENNIEDFAKFIAYLVNEGLKGNPVAKIKS